MPHFSTTIAYVGGARCTGLHGGVVGCPLSWCLLATLLLGALIAILLLVWSSLGCAEGTDHDSTDWVVPKTSARNLAEDWYEDEYCS